MSVQQPALCINHNSHILEIINKDSPCLHLLLCIYAIEIIAVVVLTSSYVNLAIIQNVRQVQKATEKIEEVSRDGRIKKYMNKICRDDDKQIEPYILFSSNRVSMKEYDFVGMHFCLLSSYNSCSCTFWSYHPYTYFFNFFQLLLLMIYQSPKLYINNSERPSPRSLCDLRDPKAPRL